MEAEARREASGLDVRLVIRVFGSVVALLLVGLCFRSLLTKPTRVEMLSQHPWRSITNSVSEKLARPWGDLARRRRGSQYIPEMDVRPDAFRGDAPKGPDDLKAYPHPGWLKVSPDRQSPRGDAFGAAWERQSPRQSPRADGMSSTAVGRPHEDARRVQFDSRAEGGRRSSRDDARLEPDSHFVQPPTSLPEPQRRPTKFEEVRAPRRSSAPQVRRSIPAEVAAQIRRVWRAPSLMVPGAATPEPEFSKLDGP